MGKALPMFRSSRFFAISLAFGLALALLAPLANEALAAKASSTSGSSVEIYLDGKSPASESGVLPEGMEWNHPLKAGDMVLPRATKPLPKKSAQPALKAPTLPVGEPQAPQLSSAKGSAQPPQISSQKNSTASVMLLQGMKNALQQAGENLSAPKSEVTESQAAAAGQNQDGISDPIVLSGSKPARGAKKAVQADKAASAEESADKPLVILAPDSDGKYEPGQAPKMFMAPKGATASGDVVKKDGEIVTPEITLTDAPEPAAKASGIFGKAAAAPVDMPKATEMADEPLPLEHASTKPSSYKETAPAKPAAAATSIFGAPVAETVDDKGDDSLAAAEVPSIPSSSEMAAPHPSSFAPVPAAEKPAAKGKKGKTKCEPQVTKWTRDCGGAGYPAHFVGQIVGETRIVCPSGDARDVWLSNTCDAPSGKAEAAPRATDMAEAPAALASAPEGAPSVYVPPENGGASQDGACGTANGLASIGKPASDLCQAGEASSVGGEGPWRWSCKGRNGGMTVSCAAPVAPKTPENVAASKAAKAPGEAAPEDGKCGNAVAGGMESAPTDNLCAKGTASRVNGNGPWTWACGGTNGGQAAACSATRKTDGVCGAADKMGSESMPMRDLCAAGYASAVTGNGPWNWTCSGLHGGQAATCSASPKVNAVCGSASMSGHRTAPTDGLCSIGKASAVEGDGPWSWSCSGGFGGADVTCKAPSLTDGACGAAHGSLYTKAPDDGLCASGRPSRVTGFGPFNWTCAGSDGGSTASCTAALATKEALASVVSCGEASEALALSEPSEKLCAAGKASAVSGSGPWKWTCSDDAGHEAACSTPSASEGACGGAANVSSASAPKAKLCAGGNASDVTPDRKDNVWKWDCRGSMGGSTVACTAPINAAAAPKVFGKEAEAQAAPAPLAQCGSASGQGFNSAPSSNLCETGKAGSVRGHGPWNWTCSGKSGAKAECEAFKLADGVCGSSNGSIQKTAPSAGLCASGAATEVTGSGPWMWSCVGTGGGSSVSCSAAAQSQTKVDGTCGAAANALMTSAPEANLCDSGVPSTVYGEGPWTWTCSGMNGGIASTCSTSKVLPKAPPPPGPAVNGLCGPMNGVASLEEPDHDALCSAGTTSAISGNGPWNWSCIGANGGMTVSCTAPLTPPAPIVGACGASSGVPTLTAPKSSLCAAGITSAVSGKGPWTWSCSGTNGGGAVSCVAPLAGRGNEGLPSLSTPSLDSGEAPTPKAAPVGLVTPQLPAGPLPPLKPGSVPKLKTSKKLDNPPEASALPAAKLKETVKEEVKATDNVMPEPIRDDSKPVPGVKAPVLDSEGKPVSVNRLALESDVSVISFTRGSDQLDKDAVTAIEKLANILLANGNVRITLIAYSDTDGKISPRDARRISLNRALAIRDFLTTKGVPSSRVDVRPMGANVPSGDMDRVDVKVN